MYYLHNWTFSLNCKVKEYKLRVYLYRVNINQPHDVICLPFNLAITCQTRSNTSGHQNKSFSHHVIFRQNKVSDGQPNQIKQQS